ncbi:MAG: HepT-like ribonuclease domain-containing protein [Trueperaceae bacterium]
MVGFSNVAVHDYRRLDLAVVDAIVARHLDDLLAFAGRPRWASLEHLALADGQISKT